jgi:mRNA interferase MazF
VTYLPEQGDLAWINFDPQAGREQAKNRPALIVTASDFNAATGLPVVCPVNRAERPWRTRIPPVGTTTSGFIMIEQLKSLDWRARGAAFIERVPEALFEDVKSGITTMLDLLPRPGDQSARALPMVGGLR